MVHGEVADYIKGKMGDISYSDILRIVKENGDLCDLSGKVQKIRKIRTRKCSFNLKEC